MALRLGVPVGLGTGVDDGVMLGEGAEDGGSVVIGAGNVLVSTTGIAVSLGVALSGTCDKLQEARIAVHISIAERESRWTTGWLVEG